MTIMLTHDFCIIYRFILVVGSDDFLARFKNKIWKKRVAFLSRYAQKANPKRGKEKGRLQCGLNPIIS